MSCTDFLTATAFGLTIDSPEFHGLEMGVVTFTHPEVSVRAATAAANRKAVPFVGDTITIGSLQIEFLIPSDLSSLEKIESWIQQGVNGTGENQLDRRDMTLIIYGPQNIPVASWRYMEAFPVSRGSISFSAKDTGNTPLTFSVTFEIMDYELNLI